METRANPAQVQGAETSNPSASPQGARPLFEVELADGLVFDADTLRDFEAEVRESYPDAVGMFVAYEDMEGDTSPYRGSIAIYPIDDESLLAAVSEG